jgi:hypothetical protein
MADHKGTQVPSLAPNYYDAVYMIKGQSKRRRNRRPKKLKEERKKNRRLSPECQGFKGLLFEWDNVNGVAMTKPTYIFEIRNGRKNLVLEVKPGL